MFFFLNYLFVREREKNRLVHASNSCGASPKPGANLGIPHGWQEVNTYFITAPSQGRAPKELVPAAVAGPQALVRGSVAPWPLNQCLKH